jgi:hypothetical protein
VVIGASVQTKEEADELAKSLLRKRAYEFITGKGSIIGLPDLRPGDNMTICANRMTGTVRNERARHRLPVRRSGRIPFRPLWRTRHRE